MRLTPFTPSLSFHFFLFLGSHIKNSKRILSRGIEKEEKKWRRSPLRAYSHSHTITPPNLRNKEEEIRDLLGRCVCECVHEVVRCALELQSLDAFKGNRDKDILRRP